MEEAHIPIPMECSDDQLNGELLYIISIEI